MTVAVECWRAVFQACGLNARRRSARVFASLLACITPVASGAGSLSASDAVAVPQEFLACTTCHGVDLAGNAAVNAPRLAGLPAWYVHDQLYAFRRGWRGLHADDAHGAVMQVQAADIEEDTIERVSEYVENAGSFASGARSRMNLTPERQARGARYYRSCAACHGQDGAGSDTLRAPPLTGFSQDYLVRQLRLFRSGARGYHPDDAAGAAMHAAVNVLPDDAAMYAVAAYIVGQIPGQKSGSEPAPLEPGSTTQPEDSAVQSKNKASSLVGMAGAATLALSVGVGNSASAEVRRHKLPDSDFPIAQAVEVLPGTTLVYHSGMIPRPADPDAEQYSPEYWGDTEAQALSVFSRLQDSLTAKGLTFGDVIKMQVFLVAPEAGGMMDFEGMMRAYRRYFGTDDQPKLPARSAMQVAGLARPGMLVEIEVVLARP